MQYNNNYYKIIIQYFIYSTISSYILYSTLCSIIESISIMMCNIKKQIYSIIYGQYNIKYIINIYKLI